MRGRSLVLTILVVVTAASALAQQPAPTPKPAAEQPAPAAAPATPSTSSPAAAVALAPRRGQPVNIRIDVTITDQHGGTAALKKTVSVVTADQQGGLIRSTANYSSIGDVPLNLDVLPELIADGKIRVGVNLQYDLPGSAARPADSGATQPDANVGWLRRTQIRENLNVILENGKPISIAQAADPVGDRQVTIEVKATVLR